MTLDLSRLVVTHIEPYGGAKIEDAPLLFPLEVSEVCAIVGVARQTIHNTLSLYPERFDAPRYQPSGKRYLTVRDIETLKAMYPRRTTPRSTPSRGKTHS